MPGEMPQPPLPDGRRPGAGRGALFGRRAGGGVPAVGNLPAGEVPAQAPPAPGHRGGVPDPAGGRGRPGRLADRARGAGGARPGRGAGEARRGRPRHPGPGAGAARHPGPGAGAAPTSAMQLLRRAWRQYPADFWVNEHLGLLLWETEPQRWEEAVRYLTAAVALRSDVLGAHFNLGIVLKGGGQLDEAIACYRKAVELGPKYAPAHNNLGSAL